jgi:hypothetical protein
MEYNTSRTKMLMPEYGRNVQKMVEYLLTIEDPEKRLRNAEVIIELMGTLNPHLKIIEDYKHKLWDHLYQMTELKLEVDSPYPPPTAEELARRPEVLPYPQTRLEHKHLGKNLGALLEKGMAEPDDERRQGYTQTIGYYMKLAYTNWHKEPIHDDMIKNELAEITKGAMQYETGGFRVHFDSRPNNNFKRNNQGNQAGQGNRNFKGASGRPNNNNSRGGNFGNRSADGGGNSFGNNRGGESAGGNYGGFNKNRKFNKNKNKNS